MFTNPYYSNQQHWHKLLHTFQNLISLFDNRPVWTKLIRSVLSPWITLNIIWVGLNTICSMYLYEYAYNTIFYLTNTY